MAAILELRPKAGSPTMSGRGSRRVDGALWIFNGASMVVNRNGYVGFLSAQLGSGLIDHSQNMTAAAMQIAEK